MRLYKPARSKEVYRGYFSYLTEAVGNLISFYDKIECNDLKIYFDLCDIPGYGVGNIFDKAFVQDYDDYQNNFYGNLEDYGCGLNPYSTSFDITLRKKSENIIAKHFIVNDEIKNLINNRFKNYNVNNILGVHYRTTDIKLHHPIVDIHKIFETIDNSDFEYIFLATDAMSEYEKFSKRYGSKVLFFDNTASNNDEVFFKKNNEQEIIDQHIKEMVFNAYVLSKFRKLICTRSNVSTFSILANSNLEYIINC
jgi:hypothetical protein